MLNIGHLLLSKISRDGASQRNYNVGSYYKKELELEKLNVRHSFYYQTLVDLDT